MDAPNSFKGERCGIDNCRSRRYHLSDEGYACEQGHVHTEIPVRGEDEDEWGPSGRVTRSSSASTVREKVLKHFTGRKAFELYLQCYQLVLRKQCYFLIQQRGYPDEFEVTVRDLWTLRIQHLKSRIDDTNTGDSGSDSQSQAFSSQSEDEELEIEATTRQIAASSPRIVDTLGLLYLAAVLLRLPVLPADLFDDASEGRLLYYGASRNTPVDMRARLRPEYHEALEPRLPLSYEAVGKAIRSVASFFHKEVGTTFPPLNFPPLCLRCVQQLALPLPVYAAVAELKKMAEYQMSYEDWDRKRGRRITQASYPDAQLASLIVVACKLLYPFEGIRREPSHAGDFAAMFLDWDAWLTAMQEVDTKKTKTGERKSMNYSSAVKTTEEDVMNMSPEELDEYMGWYAANWTRDGVDPTNKEAGFRRDLLAMFPMSTFPSTDRTEQTAHEHGVAESVRAVVAAMLPVESSSGGDAGTNDIYHEWRTEADLNERAKRFCRAVAKVVGLPLDRLIRAVFFTEKRLYRWSEQRRKG